MSPPLLQRQGSLVHNSSLWGLFRKGEAGSRVRWEGQRPTVWDPEVHRQCRNRKLLEEHDPSPPPHLIAQKLFRNLRRTMGLPHAKKKRKGLGMCAVIKGTLLDDVRFRVK